MPDVARARCDDADVVLTRFIECIAIGVAGVSLSAVEKYIGAEHPDDGRDSTDMVAMRMRQQDRINMMDPLSDQKRYDDLLAD